MCDCDPVCKRREDGMNGAALRVLLVEDELIIAMMVESVITNMGFEVIGPVVHIDQALRLVADGEFDCAILDVNIRGGNSYAVADLLIARDCPFVMATGYSDWSIPPHLIGQKRLTKPYSTEALESELKLLSAKVSAKRGKPMNAASEPIT